MSTRRRYYAKWILIYGRETEDHPFQCVQTHVFDCNTVQHLVVSGHGVLLPPSMSKIMDAMDGWGRGRSSRWYKDTLSLFWFYTREKMNVSERELLRETIKIHVFALLKIYFDGEGGWTIYNEWVDFFNYKYDYETKVFFHIARKSLGFVHDKCVAAITNTTNVTAPTPVESISSSPALVSP